MVCEQFQALPRPLLGLVFGCLNVYAVQRLVCCAWRDTRAAWTKASVENKGELMQLLARCEPAAIRELHAMGDLLLARWEFTETLLAHCGTFSRLRKLSIRCSGVS